MNYPKCKRCAAKDVPTNEWFGDGPYNRQHLCDRCFKIETRGIENISG